MKLKLKSHDGGTTAVNVDDPSRTVDIRYTVQPGARFPWHTHYGPVIVNIVSGSSQIRDAGDSLRENDLPRLAAWGEQCSKCDLAELCRDVPALDKAARRAASGR